MNLYRNSWLRRLAFLFLKFFNRDFYINHPWTRDKFKLALFEHKGYWFHRRNREVDEMIAFERLLFPGAQVLEVGGHIGFISLYYAQLVTTSGKVVVFEPGPNNIKYLTENIAQHVTLFWRNFCSDIDGQSTLFIDNLTGQNNSLVSQFDGLLSNALAAPGIRVTTTPVTIPTIMIDTYCQQSDFHPDFIKIDVEGHELAVLRGAEILLNSANPPMLMVEIQSDHNKILDP